MNNVERVGRFTSSRIFCLLDGGRSTWNTEEVWSSGAITYMKEKIAERRFGRTLDGGGAKSEPARWGLFMEMIIFSLLGLEWQIESNQTKAHPRYPNWWSGSRDLFVPKKKIGEIKCYQPKKFCQFNDVLMAKDVDLLRSEFKQEYWQMVSNAAISGVKRAEAISYMPYISEMPAIKELAYNYDGENQWYYRFIAERSNDELPVLQEGGYYSNITRFEFEIPQRDFDYLEERIKLAIIEMEIEINK